MTELHRPEPLDLERHNRSAFESGSWNLDEWLRRYSGQNCRRNTAATWVITTADLAVVAYVSVAMTCIDRSVAPSPVAKHAPDPVPALLIGRLAVDRNYSGLGTGTALVAHVLATAVDLNDKAACRAVVVSAIDETAQSWWENFGFHRFDPTDPDNLDLYLLTAEIDATMQAQRR